MTRSELKERLELVKTALVCVALVAVIASSCDSRKKSSEVLSQITQLRLVVQETAETNWRPVANEPEKTP